MPTKNYILPVYRFDYWNCSPKKIQIRIQLSKREINQIECLLIIYSEPRLSY